MNQRWIGLFVLAAVVVLGGIAAGCIDVPGAATAEPESPTPPAAAGNVVAGSNAFACDLYHRLANDSATENIFFSPVSISSALAITYEGARGTTAGEIASVLHLPGNETLRRTGFAALTGGLSRGDANTTLRTANALWAEETYPFLPEYIETAERYYAANVTNLDFIGAPEESRQTINRWVERQTEEKIQDLLPAGSIDPLTRLVITNAIYFTGTWELQFDANETADADFRVSPDETVRVPMMQRTGEDAVYPYAETDTLQALAMTYAGGSNLSMLVLLPKDGNLTAAEEACGAENLAELRQALARERVDVFFPKFALEEEYSLPETLTAMGMPAAFTGAADFSGMDGTKNLFITAVVHKAFVNVNEEGTEAAAATGVAVSLSAAPIDEEVPVFRADHPFVFVILDDDTGTILFIGRVFRPPAA
ncbi:serpin family protein [Methanoculleus sp. FWC-SCC1]|uniref:Serpin family protein n=1 Tax=Methanoculleus frigidifontis TaxID=2584085 RepID=A0ABT8M779_9EURY|nr:serpin family protein [Methanoculleus sp. FWC-SCC1]MDN7023787.1 serpin family protein [Methanoculleus sp. FWC-SCC1]